MPALARSSAAPARPLARPLARSLVPLLPRSPALVRWYHGCRALDGSVGVPAAPRVPSGMPSFARAAGARWCPRLQGRPLRQARSLVTTADAFSGASAGVSTTPCVPSCVPSGVLWLARPAITRKRAYQRMCEHCQDTGGRTRDRARYGIGERINGGTSERTNQQISRRWHQ